MTPNVLTETAQLDPGVIKPHLGFVCMIRQSYEKSISENFIPNNDYKNTYWETNVMLCFMIYVVVVGWWDCRTRTMAESIVSATIIRHTSAAAPQSCTGKESSILMQHIKLFFDGNFHAIRNIPNMYECSGKFCRKRNNTVMENSRG